MLFDLFHGFIYSNIFSNNNFSFRNSLSYHLKFYLKIFNFRIFIEIYET